MSVARIDRRFSRHGCFELSRWRSSERQRHRGGPRPQGGVYAHPCFPGFANADLDEKAPCRPTPPTGTAPRGASMSIRRLPKADALRLVSNPATGRPSMISCRLSRSRNASGVTVGSRARRSRSRAPRSEVLAYPSNRDGYISHITPERLGSLYEVELALRGLGDCVIGYRKGSSKHRPRAGGFSRDPSAGRLRGGLPRHQRLFR